jgi:hypothetical protein
MIGEFHIGPRELEVLDALNPEPRSFGQLRRDLVAINECDESAAALRAELAGLGGLGLVAEHAGLFSLTSAGRKTLVDS